VSPERRIASEISHFLETPSRQARTLDVVDHRPWPVPRRSWIQGQTWEHLLFAHWRVAEDALRSHVPDELSLDSFDGSCWLGVTPFRVDGLRLRGTPPVPGLSSFLELNVRTYVTYGDKPGIWFFSLDAESRLAVEAARRTYALPYHHASMRAHHLGDAVDYFSRRRDDGHRFDGRYRPTGVPAPPQPGTLEHFLTERYCLYTTRDGELFRAEIHHPPWPLQPGEAEIRENTMPPPGIELEGDPLYHFSGRQDVVIWPIEPARSAA
jgi:uncharacterized protein YqjF (DUF2071 family)